MNIEEQIKIVKNMLLHAETQLLDYEAIAIETLLIAYEKEKEKCEKLSYKLIEYDKTLERLQKETIWKDRLIELRQIENIDLLQCKLRKLLEEE